MRCLNSPVQCASGCTSISGGFLQTVCKCCHNAAGAVSENCVDTVQDLNDVNRQLANFAGAQIGISRLMMAYVVGQVLPCTISHVLGCSVVSTVFLARLPSRISNQLLLWLPLLLRLPKACGHQRRVMDKRSGGSKGSFWCWAIADCNVGINADVPCAPLFCGLRRYMQLIY